MALATHARQELGMSDGLRATIAGGAGLSGDFLP